MTDVMESASEEEPDDGESGGSRGGGAWLSTEPETTDGLKAFGEVLRAFRKRAGLTQEELAPLVRYSLWTVASTEQGRRYPQPEFVERAEEALDAFGALRGAARHLARQPGLARWFRQWARLEAEAISLSTYECRMIPGLLQTEAYARTMYANHLPPLDDLEIEAFWEARAERKQLLTQRPNTAYSFILEEHLFLRRTGGTGVTRELIDHVLEIADLRNVEVQLMPLEQENHAGLHGPIQLLETPENRCFSYSEGHETGQFVTDLKVISVHQMRYARMRSQALSPVDSLGLLQRMRGAL